MAWLSGSTLVSINVVTVRWARLILGWMRLRVGKPKPSPYVTSLIGQVYPCRVDKSSIQVLGFLAGVKAGARSRVSGGK